MKRDLELIRKILEAVESTEYAYGVNLKIEGYDLNTIAFHMSLLVEAGYLKASISKAASGEYVHAWPQRLTWEGCEFLDLARNDTTWQKSKALIKEKSVGVSVSLLVELLKSIAKSTLGI